MRYVCLKQKTFDIIQMDGIIGYVFIRLIIFLSLSGNFPHGNPPIYGLRPHISMRGDFPASHVWLPHDKFINIL